MRRFHHCVEQMESARDYTRVLLNDLTDEDWFRMPSDVTHVAWQVGHLLVCQHSLILHRVAGSLLDVPPLVTDEWRHWFGKGSKPASNVAAYPHHTDILQMFEGVHRHCIETLRSMPDNVADEVANGVPHPMFVTKLEAVRFCVHHEYLHAGQIGLLRREIGHSAIRLP